MVIIIIVNSKDDYYYSQFQENSRTIGDPLTISHIAYLQTTYTSPALIKTNALHIKYTTNRHHTNAGLHNEVIIANDILTYLFPIWCLFKYIPYLTIHWTQILNTFINNWISLLYWLVSQICCKWATWNSVLYERAGTILVKHYRLLMSQLLGDHSHVYANWKTSSSITIHPSIYCIDIRMQPFMYSL